jgi:hypothetical protein
MSFRPGVRVSGLATIRGISFAQQHFLEAYPRDWKQKRIEGVVVLAEGAGKYIKWRVRWDIDGVETVHAEFSLTPVASQASHQQADVSSSSVNGTNRVQSLNSRNTGSSSVAASVPAVFPVPEDNSSLDEDYVDDGDDETDESDSLDSSDEEDDESLEEDEKMDVDDVPNPAANLPRPLPVVPPPPVGDALAMAASLFMNPQMPRPVQPPLNDPIQAADMLPALPVAPIVTAHDLQWFSVPEDYSIVPPQLYNGVGRLRWIGVEKPDVDQRTPWDYFQLMFPMQFSQDIIDATRANGVDGFDSFEFFQMLGILLAQGCTPQRSMRDWWGQNSDDRFLQPRVRELGFTLSRDRFEKIVSQLRFGHYGADEIKADPWAPVSQLVQAFNQRRAQVVIPGKFLCADEDTSRWTATRSEAKYKPGGVPALTKIKAKPEPVSIMLKSLCDSDTYIKLFLEIQEGKERMAQKPYAKLGAGVAWLLRLTSQYQGTHRIVCADSAFASVKSAVELHSRGLYFMGVVKTATKKFPKKYLSKYPFQRCGEHLVSWNSISGGWYGYLFLLYRL